MTSVLDYGPVGDGVTNDRAAIQAALDGEAGGLVEFPDLVFRAVGVHPESPTFGSLVVRAGTTLVGPGTLMQRPGNSILEINGVNDVTIDGLNFEVAEPGPFAAAIIAQLGSQNIQVLGCRIEFIDVAPEVAADPSLTLHAFLANSGADGILIQDCVVEGAQIKAAGTGDHADILVRRCISRRPRNLGISVVVANGSIENVLIEHNLIEDPAGQGGIYVGSDDEEDPCESLRNVLIRRNEVRGEFTGSQAPGSGALGILVRPGLITEGVVIVNNALLGDGSASTSIGLKFDGTSPDCRVTDLRVAGNRIGGFRGHGLSLAGGRVEYAEVKRNRVLGVQDSDGVPAFGEGILIQRGHWLDLIVEGNRSVGSRSHGLHFSASRPGDSIMVRAKKNVLRHSFADGLRFDAAAGARIVGQARANIIRDGYQRGIGKGCAGTITIRGSNELSGNQV